MLIHPPLSITGRLLPGVEVGGATISIEYAHVTSDGRQAYRWFIDGVGEENWHSDNLCRGAGGSLQEGLEDLLGFLGAFAEACRNHYPDCGLEQENTNLFPRGLAFWAVENADEFTTLELELQENPGKFIVE